MHIALTVRSQTKSGSFPNPFVLFPPRLVFCSRCLIAITEKYFTTNYFDQYLSGAQADQEVLKDLIKEKLPRLAVHLENLDIDISTVTLNWFLAIYFDAVPFEVSLLLSVFVFHKEICARQIVANLRARACVHVHVCAPKIDQKP